MAASAAPIGAGPSLLVRRGLDRHRAGRLAEAAQWYQRAHEEDPGDADAVALLSVLARRAGQPEAAVRLAMLAAEQRPEAIGLQLNLAEAHLRAGRTEACAACCRRLLREHPECGAAWRRLGEAEAARGNEDEAQRAWEQAIACGDGSGRAERSLGHLLARRGQLGAAAQTYRAGLEKAPRDATLHFALGAVLAASGERREAKAAYRAALRLRSGYPEALLNLGNLEYNEGAWMQAALCYRKALAAKPNYAKAWCNLGNALQMLGSPQAAAECYERILAVAPQNVAAHHNLGNGWLARKDFRRAEECFRQALGLEECAEHFNDLGNALFQQRRTGEAAVCYQRALELEPGYAAAHTNLANALMREGRTAEMIAHYQRALELDPGSAGGHYNLGLAYLRAGRYREGWREHEWRWDFRELRLHRRGFSAPQWRGEAFEGKTLLLHGEQGLGDTLQFARYAPLAVERGGRVLLEVQPGLKRLLATLPGVVGTFARGEALPPFAWHCPLMSLPLAFGTEVETIPARVPYLEVDERAVEAAWRRWPGGGWRVGIAWAGNPKHGNDAQRSMSLRALLPVADVPGIRWFSLQAGAAARQLARLKGKFPAVDALAGLTDFAETAALAATLDLVISVDTSVAHLAGGMGIPTWVALSQMADWRWLEEREDSPWYPTARLFRQQRAGDWALVVERMRDELQKLTAAAPRRIM